jgi:hypothetical protein
MPLASGNKSYKWANATQGIIGQIVYVSAADTADFTTGVTLFPRGVLLNAPKQNETAQINFPAQGSLITILADGTTDIAVGDRLKSNATGRAIKAGAKSGTYVTTEVWIVGHAEQAFTTNGDGLIMAYWDPHEGHWT